MLKIQVYARGIWENVSTPNVLNNRCDAYEACNQLARGMSKYTFRVIESGQPPIVYAEIEQKIKHKIKWE